MDTSGLQAQAALAGGDYVDAVSAYTRAAEFASADGYTGLAAIFIGYEVNCALLGGIGTEEAIAKAEEAVALARQSGMPGAIVLTLNSLALALVDHDPTRSRAVLRESIELGEHAGRGNIVGCSHRQPRRRPASGLEPHPRTDCSDHAPMAMEQCPDAKRAVPRAVRTSVR